MFCGYREIWRIFMIGNRWKKFVGVLLVGCWFLIVLFVTIIGRIRTEVPTIELRVFWCVREAWIEKNAFDWYFVVGNIIMFIPAGLVLPMFFENMRKWGKTALLGLSFSVLIECLQLILHLGLFEIDDMINNTFGCVLGYALFVMGMWLLGKGASVRDKVISLGLWLLTIAFFSVAVCLGQPVFDLF